MAKGLPDVEQKVSVDADDAVKGYKDAEEGAERYADAVDDAEDSVRDLAVAHDEAARHVGDLTRVIREQQAALEEYHGSSDVFREQADAMAALREQYTSLGGSAAEIAAGQHELAASFLDVQRGAESAVRAHSDYVSVTDAVASRMGSAGDAARSYAGDLGVLESRVRSVRDAAEDAGSVLGSIAVSAASGGGGGSAFGGSLTDIGRALDQIALNAGFASYRDLMSASAGGGAALTARRFYGTGPMPPPSGTGGGFTGGLWPAAPSGGGGGGGGGLLTAAGYADAITNWAGRVAPAVHYVTMAIAELAATVVPAAVALGAAGFVGLQGGQQMVTRIAAINTVEQSLGGAYGGTTGTFLGLQPKLQELQNYAQGGVYEIAGAGINLLKSGFGSAFGSEGVQTIAMIDRGVADMQNNIAAKGTGAELGSLLGQGTNYLRQFGDIGSNIGNSILNIAPHLPGVGEDWLASLEGITGGIAGGTGFLDTHHMGDVIGGLMAGEAGWRLGTPLLGLAGKGLTGLGGLAAKAGLGVLPLGEKEIAALAASTGIDASLIDAGGSGLAGGLGAVGADLGALTGPAVAGLAVSAFLGSKLISSMPSPAQRLVSGMQSQIGKEGYTAALGLTAPPGFESQGWLPLGKAITETTGLAATAAQQDKYASVSSFMGASQGIASYARFGPQGETTAQIYQNAAAGFEKQMGDLISSGPQLVKVLDGLGLKGTSMGDAFQIAQNSLLDLSHAFGANGKLNKQATTMIGNYVSALEPMTQNAGALGAAIGAQTIMSQGSVKQLQEVNQSMDSMSSIMTGGAAGAATLFGLLGGSPVTVKKDSGIQLNAPSAYKNFAKALTSFTSPTGAADWNTVAGSSGLMAAEEQNLDQLRTWLTLGAIGPGGSAGLGVAAGMTKVPGGATGMAAFQLEQMLPMAKQSPAFLSMLMQQGAQMGVGGYYNQGESLAKNYQAAEKAFGKMADTAPQFNAAMNTATVNASQIPTIAKEFSTTVGTTVQSQEAAKAATDLIGIQKQALSGGVNQAALKDWVATLKGAGVEGGKAITGTLDSQLKAMGVSQTMIVKINAEVGKVNIPKPKNQTYQISGVIAKYAIPKPPDQMYKVLPQVKMPQIPHIPDQSFNIVGHVMIAGGGSAIATSTIAGGGGGMRLMSQHGMLVPGHGSGDIVPAMLEPGEAIVPRHLVGPIAPFLAANKVPGFQAGGFAGAEGFGASTLSFNTMYSSMLEALEGLMGSYASGLSGTIQNAFSSYARMGAGMFRGAPVASNAPDGTPANPVAVQVMSGAGGGIPAGALGAAPIPAAAQKVIDAFEKTFKSMGNPWGNFASQIMQGLLDSVKDASKETAAEAKALTAKVTQEVSFAKSTAATSVAGLNFAGMSNLPTPAMTAQGQPYQYYADQASGNPLSVQQQMGDYLQSIQSFQGDIGKLSKGGLNKNLIKQLLGAGPLQGDEEAQSILGGAGGIGGVNKLWSQINAASGKLGISGAEDVYGYGGAGKSAKVDVTTNAHAAQAAINEIHGKSVVIDVNLQVHGGSGGLTTSQINKVVSTVQARLLEQAKRNRATGVKLPGYGS